MSKIRTVDNLIDRLATDLAWRKKELSYLKVLIETKQLGQAKQQVLLRSGITILYANWEGYIKQAGSCYLEFVSMQQLCYCELKMNFVAIAMKDKLKEAQETNKSTIFAEVAEFILHQSRERSNIPYKNVVTTHSNLSSSILREIICMLGLNYDFFELKKNLIDQNLLARRNIIAHGEYLLIDSSEYLELHEEVLKMMEEFRTQVENGAILESYRR